MENIIFFRVAMLGSLALRPSHHMSTYIIYVYISYLCIPVTIQMNIIIPFDEV